MTDNIHWHVEIGGTKGNQARYFEELQLFVLELKQNSPQREVEPIVLYLILS